MREKRHEPCEMNCALTCWVWYEMKKNDPIYVYKQYI